MIVDAHHHLWRKPRIRAGAAGLAEWREPFAALATQPNVNAKLSGLVTEATWTEWSVDDLRPVVAAPVGSFGPDRLMFGSDWPVCLLAASYPEVKQALTASLPRFPRPNTLRSSAAPRCGPTNSWSGN